MSRRKKTTVALRGFTEHYFPVGCASCSTVVDGTLETGRRRITVSLQYLPLVPPACWRLTRSSRRAAFASTAADSGQPCGVGVGRLLFRAFRVSIAL